MLIEREIGHQALQLRVLFAQLRQLKLKDNRFGWISPNVHK